MMHNSPARLREKKIALPGVSKLVPYTTLMQQTVEVTCAVLHGKDSARLGQLKLLGP
jgi:hypothetical protein